MATIALQITAAGPVAPSYADILQQLKINSWSIFGSDAVFDADTQDGQLLAIFAQAIYDTNQGGLAVYNAFSPTTAQGAGLASVVKINGLRKKVPTNSQVVVTIVGQVGSIINGGQIGDDLNLGTQWSLPDTVTIPLAGTIDVTATCVVAGAVTAAVDSLSRILTPTLGWQSVTNAGEAVPGQPVESDAALRRRQSVSTALPAQTVLDAIYAAIANIAGVGRLAVYENDTDATDGNGIPSHSIAAVVEGGAVADIGAAIALKKSPGTGTYGTTSVDVLDAKGVPHTIHYFALTEVTVTVRVTITPLAGYVSTTADLIRQAVAGFLSGLGIGYDSYLNALFAPANLAGSAAIEATGKSQAELDLLRTTFHVTAVLQAKGANPLLAQDLVLAFNEAALTTVDDVEVV